MRLKKLAAIDIGSNSVRLLIMNVIHDEKTGHTYYRKSSMIRLPVRLGADAFLTGRISKFNRRRLVQGMKAYRHLMLVHGVEDYRACATSALREAGNGEKLVRKIHKTTGIDVEIIDGAEEARLIFESKLFDAIQPEESRFLYIDVGGGSTELSLFIENEILHSRSFRIGTVRILNGIDDATEWEAMENWVEQKITSSEGLAIIASGGNINKTHKLSGKRINEPLSLRYLNNTHARLSACTHEELITEVGLNFDRADVIVPALSIYRSVMKWSGARNMYVPKIGVSDGIVRDLYHRVHKADVEEA